MDLWSSLTKGGFGSLQFVRPSLEALIEGPTPLLLRASVTFLVLRPVNLKCIFVSCVLCLYFVSFLPPRKDEFID